MNVMKEWEGFTLGKWSNDEIDVRDFIQKKYFFKRDVMGIIIAYPISG